MENTVKDRLVLLEDGDRGVLSKYFKDGKVEIGDLICIMYEDDDDGQQILTWGFLKEVIQELE